MNSGGSKKLPVLADQEIDCRCDEVRDFAERGLRRAGGSMKLPVLADHEIESRCDEVRDFAERLVCLVGTLRRAGDRQPVRRSQRLRRALFYLFGRLPRAGGQNPYKSAKVSFINPSTV